MEVVPPGVPKRHLALIALAELVLLVGFVVAVWQVWQSRQAPPGGAPPGSAQPAPPSTASPVATPIGLPQDGTATPPPAGATGSGGETPSTLLQHLAQFNGLISTVEQGETGVLEILIPGTVWYLKRVVVPRIEAALGGR